LIFNSLLYAAFLPAVVALYWVLPHRKRLWLLLAAGYTFYGWWDVRFLGLLALSTGVDYVLARWIASKTDETARKRLLWLGVAINLGILGTFKYANFFVHSANRLADTLGLGEHVSWSLGLILPVGISFYTFQSMSYTFDVYRRRTEPCEDALVYAVYVSFFPQLVAGPIERANHMLPQYRTPRPLPDRNDVRSALLLIGQGVFKKVCIADALAATAAQGFGQAGGSGSVMLLIAVYAFALQIYADFSAYTDIARGSARLLGIDLMRNFESPYLSLNITEFWRRWHISLSNWLRDYLYVPLGGNRGTGFTVARNLLITMLLGGLWHGAAWTFGVWGLLHGLFLVAHRPFRGRSMSRDEVRLRWRDALPIIGTFHLVCLAWIFFRAVSFSQAWAVLTGIFSFRGGSIGVNDVLLVALAGVITLALDLAQRRSGQQSVVLQLPPLARGAVYGLAFAGLLVYSGGAPVPFIYFQF